MKNFLLELSLYDYTTIDIVHTGKRKEDCVWCNLYHLAKTEYDSELDPLGLHEIRQVLQLRRSCRGRRTAWMRRESTLWGQCGVYRWYARPIVDLLSTWIVSVHFYFCNLFYISNKLSAWNDSV